MKTPSVILCSIVLLGPAQSSNSLRPAFISHTFLNPKPSLAATKEDDALLLDAEEAAAVDAHDIGDPGIEGAAMESAVIMAADYEREHPSHDSIHIEVDDDVDNGKPQKSIIGKIKSLFHHDDDDEVNEEDLKQLHDVEAKYAHDLSDVAAMEHANQVTEVADRKKVEEDVLTAEDLAANYAHDLSDVAALEHIKMVATAEEEYDTKEFQGNTKKDDVARIASVEEHYTSIDKDIKTIERLIEEADKWDTGEVSWTSLLA